MRYCITRIFGWGKIGEQAIPIGENLNWQQSYGWITWLLIYIMDMHEVNPYCQICSLTLPLTSLNIQYSCSWFIYANTTFWGKMFSSTCSLASAPQIKMEKWSGHVMLCILVAPFTVDFPFTLATIFLVPSTWFLVSKNWIFLSCEKFCRSAAST